MLSICLCSQYPGIAQELPLKARTFPKVLSALEDSSGNFLLLKLDSKTPLSAPRLHYLPGMDGQTVMVAEFENVLWLNSSQLIEPQFQEIDSIRLGQFQSNPPLFRISIATSNPAVLRKIEFQNNGSSLVIKLKATSKLAKSSPITHPNPTAAPAVATATMPYKNRVEASTSCPIPTALPVQVSGKQASCPLPPLAPDKKLNTAESLTPHSIPGISKSLDSNLQSRKIPTYTETGNSVAQQISQITGVDSLTSQTGGQSSKLSKQGQSTSQNTNNSKLPFTTGGLLLQAKSQSKQSQLQTLEAPDSSISTTTDSGSDRFALRGPIEIENTKMPVEAPSFRKEERLSPSPKSAPDLRKAQSISSKPIVSSSSAQDKAQGNLPEEAPSLKTNTKAPLSTNSELPKTKGFTTSSTSRSCAESSRPEQSSTPAKINTATTTTAARLPERSAPPAPGATTQTSQRMPEAAPPINSTQNEESSIESAAVYPQISVEGRNPVSIRFKFKEPVQYTSFKLDEPPRYVIDLSLPASDKLRNELKADKNDFFKSIRFGTPDEEGKTTRIVLDLEKPDLAIKAEMDSSKSLLLLTLQPASATIPSIENSTRGKIVVIDAGHGGSDPGAQRGDINEKDMTLAIAMKLKKVLEEQGIRTVMTRSDDTFVSLEDRVRITNDTAPDAFVSVHINSLETDRDIQGIETYYQTEQSKILANKIHEKLVGKLEVPDRYVRKARFYVINHTPHPAVLAEVGFISNKGERDKLISSDYQLRVADSIGQGVILFLSAATQMPPIASQAVVPGSQASSAALSANSKQTLAQDDSNVVKQNLAKKEAPRRNNPSVGNKQMAQKVTDQKPIQKLGINTRRRQVLRHLAARRS